jgi:Protein of unknown function (DUF1559)
MIGRGGQGDDGPEEQMTAYRFSLRTMLFFVLAFSCGLGLIARQIRKQSNERGQAGCLSNLTAISIALHQYHHDFGCFPPAYIADRSGKPMHSWRVLVLASAGDPLRAIYDAYDFSERWDGQHNRQLAKKIPRIYACPNDSGAKNPTSTSYLAIVGTGTCFPGDKPVRFADISDGAHSTIHVVEIANSGINWMEPRDLEMSRMSLLLNDQSRPSISSNDSNGPAVLFVDGTKKRFDAAISANTLKAMMTIAGRETIGEAKRDGRKR